MMPERTDALSSASPVARVLYEELLRAIAPFGKPLQQLRIEIAIDTFTC